MSENLSKNSESIEKRSLSSKSTFYFNRVPTFYRRAGNNNQKKSYSRMNEAQITSSKNLQVFSLKKFNFSQAAFLTNRKFEQKRQQNQKKQTKVPSFFRNKSKQKQQNFLPVNIHQKSLKKIKSYFQSTNSNPLISNRIQVQNQLWKKPFGEIINKSQQMNEYNKLNKKINYLMDKIRSMGAALDMRRQQKLEFLQNQKKQRTKFFQNDKDIQILDNSNSTLKKFITQVPQFKGLHGMPQNPYSAKDSIYYVSQVLRAYKDEQSLVRSHLVSSIQYLRMFNKTRIPQQREIQHMKVNLPRLKGYENKKTIIFDLDETLIHCDQNILLQNDCKVKIMLPTSENIEIGINIRPFAKEILESLSKNFQIIVFTASHQCYANVVLDCLDPQKKYIHHRLFRQNCYCTSEGVYVKDLRIINRPLQKMILVDNAAYSYGHQPLNGVPIIPYYEGKNDYELQALLKYIESIRYSADLREKNRKTFKLDLYHHFQDHISLVQMLYGSSKS